jgi:serine/threonine protein phosphatase 1
MAAVVSRHVYVLPRAVEPNVEVFAIGDIHGRPDLLLALLDEAAREPRRRERRVIVFLGDLIDRGPDSLGAIDLAVGARERIHADESVMLMGNHEAMLRLVLDPATPWEAALDALIHWLRNGGTAVAEQFVDLNDALKDPEDFLTVLRVAAPPGLRNWLFSLRPWRRSADLLFVHAGVNPAEPLAAFLARPWNVPLAELEADRHWAWVRRPFLEAEPDEDGFSGLFVVHGHTPNDAGVAPAAERQIARFRLNLDAGSGLTGQAKMAVFCGNEARVFTALGPTNRMLRRL